MKKERKREVVGELTEQLAGSRFVALMNFKGLSVREMQELRGQVRRRKGCMRVVKNTLLERALQDSSRKAMSENLKGPMLLVWTAEEDEIALVKVLLDFQRKAEKIAFAAGILDDRMLDRTLLQAIGSLPGKKELQARVVCAIRSPLVSLARILHAPAMRIVNVITQVQETKERGNGNKG